MTIKKNCIFCKHLYIIWAKSFLSDPSPLIALSCQSLNYSLRQCSLRDSTGVTLKFHATSPCLTSDQTWDLSKILHPRNFRLKLLHHQFHLISTVVVIKTQKNEWKWRNLHHWQNFYTAAGSDRRDKSHLWVEAKVVTMTCFISI